MAKRYVIFIDEEQLRIVLANMQTVLSLAIDSKRPELIIPLAGLVNQLKNPREIREKNRSLFTLAKDQVLGK